MNKIFVKKKKQAMESDPAITKVHHFPSLASIIVDNILRLSAKPVFTFLRETHPSLLQHFPPDLHGQYPLLTAGEKILDISYHCLKIFSPHE